MAVVPITVTYDLSAGATFHWLSPAPFPPFPGLMCPALEVSIPHKWPPGVGLGLVKQTSTVLHNGCSIIQQGSDCGPLIPQVTANPLNTWLPLILAKSKRAVVFSAFSVRMDGVPAACASAWPFLPQLTCADPVATPTTVTFTNGGHSVFVGASAADIAGGLVSCAGAMLCDAMRTVGTSKAVEFGKVLIATAFGLAASRVQHEIDPRYPVKVDFGVKLPGGHAVGVSVSRDSSDTTNNPDQISVSASCTQTDPSGVVTSKVEAKVTITTDAGAKPEKEGIKAQVGETMSTVAGNEKVEGSAEYNPKDTGNELKAKAKATVTDANADSVSETVDASKKDGVTVGAPKVGKGW